MNNPRITRSLCLLLIIALLFPIGSSIHEIFFRKQNADGSLTTVLFFLCFCLINYFITFRYCNKLIKQSISKAHNNKFLFFLVSSVITFSCSAFTVLLIAIGFYELTKEELGTSVVNGILDVMTIAGLVIFALIGPFVFFMQIKIRKSLINRESSLDELIESIGSEEKSNI